MVIICSGTNLINLQYNKWVSCKMPQNKKVA
jgi:hypothetical protein